MKKNAVVLHKRAVELNLSNEDAQKLSVKAGLVGLTVAELLQSFIGDLIDGTQTNGSDERMYANQWFERCGFSYSPYGCSFLCYLLQNDEIDDVLSSWELIQEGKQDLIEEDCEEEKAGIEEDISYWQNQLSYYWENYLNYVSTRSSSGKGNYGTFDENMTEVLEWKKINQQFLSE